MNAGGDKPVVLLVEGGRKVGKKKGSVDSKGTATTMLAGGDGASRGPWSPGVRVCVRAGGHAEPMVDLWDMDADEVGRAVGLAGSRPQHSGRWLWVRGPDLARSAGSRAVRGVWLFSGLPRPSVTVCGSGGSHDGAVVVPLVVRVSSSVDGVSGWTVRAVARWGRWRRA